MKTINDIIAIFPWTKAEEWKQHDKGKGWVQITAYVEATATIMGVVYGNAQVSGDAQVFGDALVLGNSQVSGNALVFGNAQVFGDAQVFGNARVLGDGWEQSPHYVQGTKHAATNSKYGYIAIGCQVHTFAHWQANVEEIARDHGYTEAEVAEYRAIVDFMVKVGK